MAGKRRRLPNEATLRAISDVEKGKIQKAKNLTELFRQIGIGQKKICRNKAKLRAQAVSAKWKKRLSGRRQSDSAKLIREDRNR